MNNYKLTIQYDGTDFSGWQRQKNSLSVQGILEEKINMLLREEVSLIGSGRTDSGVHALGQVANFRAEASMDLQKFLYSLNSVLPASISILEIKSVEENFHSRFDAKKRNYIYLISNFKSPFYYKYSYFAPNIYSLDLEKLNLLSKTLIGEHDFTSLSRKNDTIDNKKCSVYAAHWRKVKGFLVFYIEANRFLHGMVRTIVGTIIKGVSENSSQNFMIEIIRKKNREEAWEAFPAKGLFLNKVRY